SRETRRLPRAWYRRATDQEPGSHGLYLATDSPGTSARLSVTDQGKVPGECGVLVSRETCNGGYSPVDARPAGRRRARDGSRETASTHGNGWCYPLLR